MLAISKLLYYEEDPTVLFGFMVAPAPEEQDEKKIKRISIPMVP